MLSFPAGAPTPASSPRRRPQPRPGPLPRIVGSWPVSKVWIDGRLWAEGEARISPLDHAILTGDGVFETLRVDGSRPFAVRRHLDRLGRSAAGLGLTPPETSVMRRAIDEIVAANEVVAGRVRVTLTGGPAPLGSERGDAGPTLIVATGPQRPWPSTADVAIAPWPRNERGAVPGLKTVSYA